MTNLSADSFFQSPLFILILMGLLVAFALLAAKQKRIPKIPVLFFILYLGVRWLVLSGYVPAEFLGKAPLAQSMLLGFAIIRIIVFAAQEIFKLAISRVTRDAMLAIAFAIWALIVLKIQGGINPVSFLTTSAVLTLVMGLSLQNTLGNLFAGFSIQMEKPYGIGDWIECDGTVGKVTEIGWKSTRLVTRDRDLVVIPNLNITKSTIKNLSKPINLRQVSFNISIDYEVAPDHVKSVILSTLSKISQIAADPAPVVWPQEFSDFAVVYRVRFAHENIAGEDALIADVKRRCWYALKREHVRIPFPIRDIRPWSEMRREEQDSKKNLAVMCEQSINKAILFKALSADLKQKLSSASRILIFAAGEDIIVERDLGSTMYILTEGSCSVIADGKEVAVLKAGDYFGEMSLLTGEPRRATVRATTGVFAVEIRKEDIAPIMESHPEISDELALALANRQAELDKHFEADEIKGTASKIVARIRSFFGIK